RGEEDLLHLSGRQVRDLLRELDDRDRRIERRHVAEPLHLRAHGAIHGVVRVPDRERQDSAEEVEVLLPVEILYPEPLAALEDDAFVAVVVGDAREKELLML